MAEDLLSSVISGIAGGSEKLLNYFFQGDIAKKQNLDLFREQQGIKTKSELDLLAPKLEAEKKQEIFKTDEQIRKEKTMQPIKEASEIRVKQIGEDIANRKQAGVQSRSDRGIVERKQAAMKRDPVIRKIIEQQIETGDINTLIKLAQEGNQVAFAQVGAGLAKAVEGGGRLTDRDVERYVSSPSLVRGIRDKYNKLIEGKPTDLTSEDLLEISKVIQGRYRTKLEPLYESYVQDLASTLDISMDEARKELNIPNFDSYVSEKNSGTGTGSGQVIKQGKGWTLRKK